VVSKAERILAMFGGGGFGCGCEARRHGASVVGLSRWVQRPNKPAHVPFFPRVLLGVEWDQLRLVKRHHRVTIRGRGCRQRLLGVRVDSSGSLPCKRADQRAPARSLDRAA